MSLINRDPGGKVTLTAEQYRQALDFGMHPAQILCDDPDDPDRSLSFIAMLSFVPRKGEIVLLEDNSRFEVHNVLYKVSKQLDTSGKVDMITMIPSVYLLRHPKQ